MIAIRRVVATEHGLGFVLGGSTVDEPRFGLVNAACRPIGQMSWGIRGHKYRVV